MAGSTCAPGDSITREYVARHPRSAALYREALDLFPGGATHEVRRVPPFPVFMTGGRGAMKWDADGHEYVDYVMGHGALLFGHGHPELTAAAAAQLPHGTQLGANTEQEIAWARAVRALLPSVERIRFHSSGTEATMMAVRIARACTGRDRIVTFADHFHGWHDYVAGGSGRYPATGIPQATRSTVTTLPAADPAAVDPEAVDRTLAAGDVAAVMLEPTGGAMGYYALDPAFLHRLREITARRGVLLIFDEVVTGFRVSKGGAQERYGVRPDLTTLAKILAGGLPGGATGGRRELLNVLAFPPDVDPRRRIGHPGTFNANPLSAAAGTRCLQLLADGAANAAAERAARRLRQGIAGAIAAAGVTAFCHQRASIVWIVFGSAWEGDAELCTAPRAALAEGRAPRYTEPFKRALLNRGVDALGGTFIVSAVHADAQIDRTAAAVEDALRQMKADEVLR